MFSYRWTSWPAFNFIARLKKQERKKWLTFWYSIYIHLEGLIYIHIIVFEQTLNMYFNVCSITILNLHHLCIYLGSGMGMYQQFKLLVEKWKKTFLLFFCLQYLMIFQRQQQMLSFWQDTPFRVTIRSITISTYKQQRFFKKKCQEIN